MSHLFPGAVPPEPRVCSLKYLVPEQYKYQICTCRIKRFLAFSLLRLPSQLTPRLKTSPRVNSPTKWPRVNTESLE